jgi:hypothetical protein
MMVEAPSGVRILGVAVGLAMVAASFLVFRGRRWSRGNFLLAAGFGSALAAIGIDPDLVVAVQGALDIGNQPFGRIVTLLVLSNIACFVLIFYTKAKGDMVKHRLDRVLRSVTLNSLSEQDIRGRIAPVMVIIPALNEADNLKTLLPRIPRQACGFQVSALVVDDCSSDNTSEVARDHGFLVVRNLINHGQGGASRVGYDLLKHHAVQIGVTMDADNQHDPGDIEALVKPILDGTYDLVIGSRILGSHEAVSVVRSSGIAVLTWLINLLTGLAITDCSSGYKAFRMPAMARLDLREDQFQASEVLILAAKNGLRVGEVPIHVAQREHGESRKGTNFHYGFSFFKTIVKSWWR